MMATTSKGDMIVRMLRTHHDSVNSDILQDDDPCGEVFDKNSKIEFLDQNNAPYEPVSVISKEGWPMTDEQIRMQVAKYVASKPLLQSTHIQAMIYQDAVQKYAYHYRLNSFMEMREKYQKEVPFSGEGTIDGPERGTPPEVWSIAVHPPDDFCTGYRTLTVPHTQVVHVCRKCHGKGKVSCSSCSGCGYRTCSTCKGSGKISDTKSCSCCSGKERCPSCSGSGKRTCRNCTGYGKTLIYDQIKVTWSVKQENVVSGTNGLSDREIFDSKGSLIVNDVEKTVKPLKDFPDEYIGRFSNEAIEKHLSMKDRRILKQRQTVRMISNIEVTYILKGHQGKFLIYGDEQKVFFEKYPTSCVVL